MTGVWRYIIEMGLLHLNWLSFNAPVVRCSLFGCVAQGRIFTCLVSTGIPLRMTGSLTAYCQVCLRLSQLIGRLCSPLLVISTVTRRNGYTRLALMHVRGRAARDFCDLADCQQLVNGPTHRYGGTLDLVMTDVSDLSRVSVGGFLGRSDHSYISVNLSTSLRVSVFCSSRVFYQKSRAQWDLASDDL